MKEIFNEDSASLKWSIDGDVIYGEKNKVYKIQDLKDFRYSKPGILGVGLIGFTVNRKSENLGFRKEEVKKAEAVFEYLKNFPDSYMREVAANTEVASKLEAARKCERCGFVISATTNFCPNCGSPQDGMIDGGTATDGSSVMALTCQKCGSNALEMLNGLYVCQYCGTSHKVSEGNKIVILGSSSQDSNKIENLLARAKEKIASGFYKEAYEYCDKVLDLDFDNKSARTLQSEITKVSKPKIKIDFSGSTYYHEVWIKIDGKKIEKIVPDGVKSYNVEVGKHKVSISASTVNIEARSQFDEIEIKATILIFKETVNVK